MWFCKSVPPGREKVQKAWVVEFTWVYMLVFGGYSPWNPPYVCTPYPLSCDPELPMGYSSDCLYQSPCPPVSSGSPPLEGMTGIKRTKAIEVSLLGLHLRLPWCWNRE